MRKTLQNTLDTLLSNLSEETILSDEDALSCSRMLLKEVASVLSKLTPKREEFSV